MTIQEPKFLVDEMLQRFGRWLRAAGYDTRIATDSESDYYLLREAINEGRLLLTRDHKLAEMRRAQGTVILLESESMDDLAEELSAHVSIDWNFNPFTRCMVCNTVLTSTPDSDSDYRYCPSCKQVFWDGSHVTRMKHHLGHWHEKYTR